MSPTVWILATGEPVAIDVEAVRACFVDLSGKLVAQLPGVVQRW